MMHATSNASTGNNLLPDDLVERLREQTLSEFLTVYAGATFLLVKLGDPLDELRVGLSALSSLRATTPANLNVLAFHTVVADVNTAMPGFDKDVNASALRRRLSQSQHFAITIEKRVQTATYMERISVGRARNQDIVLRHPSVSKFHAWFERDASGALRVADSGSKNGTRVNQDESSRRELTKVNPGDTVRFGSVETLICSPETLWKAAQ